MPPAPPPSLRLEGLEGLEGRWEALTDRDGQEVILTPCDQESHFLEIRPDGEGGWEVLAGVEGGLQILPIRSTEPIPPVDPAREGAAGSVRIGVEGGEPIEIGWIEPGRSASVLPLFPGERFAAPARRSELRQITEEGCP